MTWHEAGVEALMRDGRTREHAEATMNKNDAYVPGQGQIVIPPGKEEEIIAMFIQRMHDPAAIIRGGLHVAMVQRNN